MLTVTPAERDLEELTAAVDRLDAAEIELEAARDALGKTLKRLHRRAYVGIQEMERRTGFSRQHVYALMGPTKATPAYARRLRREKGRL